MQSIGLLWPINSIDLLYYYTIDLLYYQSSIHYTLRIYNPSGPAFLSQVVRPWQIPFGPGPTGEDFGLRTKTGGLNG